MKILGIATGMAQGAENWGCTIVLRSNEGKITEDLFALSPKKLGLHVHLVHPLFRHPWALNICQQPKASASILSLNLCQ